ncbi:hypothetical protein [Phenylobacterium sp.]|uniref:hypothetical protein n=1 Tax=Phenylobacterium sp. TaxID=1871053 RepID=UPI0025F7962D|nr:hypothetical protein [Phenylobacterium sp.]
MQVFVSFTKVDGDTLHVNVKDIVSLQPANRIFPDDTSMVLADGSFFALHGTVSENLARIEGVPLATHPAPLP